jgi:dihydroflavonol-4-reductase
VVKVPRAVVRSAARLAVRLHVPMPFDPHVVPYATRYWFVDNAKAQRELGLSFRRAAETIGSTMEWLEGTGRLSARAR